jgi:octaprenyl-diphosphate synthase
MMVELKDMRVMEVLADATNVIAEGEVLQLLNCRDPDVTEQDYLHVIRYKTAKLFEAAGRLGAIVGRASAAVEEGLASYGTHLGTAFQLIDDVLDYSGDHAQTGKNLGDDLAGGKPTLPLIHAMRQGAAEQAVVIRAAIQRGGLEEFEPVLAAIRDTGALDYARRQAEKESKLAIAALEALPRSTYRDSLIQLAAFSVSRSY